MAETSVHGAMHRRSSGDRPNRTEGNRPPPPPPLSPRDLISTWPDAVIHHIFSFLPLEDVVKTSVLSKRWRSTWTTTTHLIFNRFRPHNNHAYSLDFPSIVNRVLTQCTSPTVKEFHVNSFEYDEADRLNLNCWLDFAAKHGVEDLRLGLTPQLPFVYVLPPFLYCLSELVRLHVSGCRFSLGTSIEWPCLKVLFIGSAELSDEILEGIFRGSPVLESLDLGGCWGVRNIVIDSTSVKRLVLSSSSVEKIWAPHLLSLWVSGTQYSSYLRGWQSPLFRLDDVSSLVEVKLYFELPYDVYDSEEKYCDMLKGLLEKLRGVPKITIDNYCLQILSLLEMKGVPSPLPKCQNLILHAPVSQWYLPGIAYMLRSSQCLEKLVIHLNGFSDLKLKLEEESKERFDFDEEDFLCSLKGNFQCLAKHLKRVEIIGYEANSFVSKHLLALIKFLLGDALMLEKMMIKADLCTWHGQEHLQATVPSELLAFRRNLLSYQRASKNAEVIFN